MWREPCEPQRRAVRVNERLLRWPSRPSVVICFDGRDPACLTAASARGGIPVIDGMCATGFSPIALAAMPTFTNQDNVSIVCGVTPAMQGVSGNSYLGRT